MAVWTDHEGFRQFQRVINRVGVVLCKLLAVREISPVPHRVYIPADGHGPGRPARLRVAMGRRGGATATGPLGPPVVVFAHGHPGPCHSSRQGYFPAAAPPRHGPAPQAAGRGGLGTVEGRGRAPEPLFSPGPGPGATPRRGHGDRGMGGDRARHGEQVDHCVRTTAHAIAAGVPLPPTGGPLLGPPTRPYEGRMEGHAEPHQGVANAPGCTVPARAGARTAHGPHTRGCHALHRALALTSSSTTRC